MLIRVATYNIHHGAGEDDVFDLDRLTAAIESFAPDLIGLQEVDRHFGDRSGNLDTFVLMGEALGLHASFGPAVVLEDGTGSCVYGNAVLSRWPIESSEVVPLPSEGDLEPRSMLVCTVVVPGADRPLTFACTHFSYESQRVRSAQMAAAADVLAHAPQPVVLVGDFNTTPDTSELRPLLEVFADSWALVGDGAGWTWPAIRPETRIDYVLVAASVQPVSADVPVTDASDHRPVSVRLRI